MALTDKLTNIANAIREKTGSTRTMNLEEMAVTVTNIKIPTALSDLNEDETHRTVTDAEKKTWHNKSNFSGNYDDLKNKPTIPTIPEKLPNPNALTFTGAVEGSYDGSAPLSVEIPSGGSDAWNLIEHITAEDAAINYEIPLQPGAKEYGIYWKYTLPDGATPPLRDIKVDESLADGFGLLCRCQTNDRLFLCVHKGPSNIIVTGQNISYQASRVTNGGTHIGTGTDFPAMTLKTNKECTTSDIWVYWR